MWKRLLEYQMWNLTSICHVLFGMCFDTTRRFLFVVLQCVKWLSVTRRFRINYKKRIWSLFYPSVRLSACKNRAPLDGFTWNLILEAFTKICRKALNLFTIGQKYRKLTYINLLKTTTRLLYLKTQSVPRCKHFPSRLQKPISLCCKYRASHKCRHASYLTRPLLCARITCYVTVIRV
jgi:hypothetical protein